MPSEGHPSRVVRAGDILRYLLARQADSRPDVAFCAALLFGLRLQKLHPQVARQFLLALETLMLERDEPREGVGLIAAMDGMITLAVDALVETDPEEVSGE